jgi:hypothetical protein
MERKWSGQVARRAPSTDVRLARLVSPGRRKKLISADPKIFGQSTVHIFSNGSQTLKIALSNLPGEKFA